MLILKTKTKIYTNALHKKNTKKPNVRFIVSSRLATFTLFDSIRDPLRNLTN